MTLSKTIVLRLAGAASAAALVAACATPAKTADASAPAAAAEAPDTGPLVRVDPATLGSIQIASVALRSAPRTLRATGKVQFDDGRVARVLAPVAGEVAGLRVSVGDRVRKNEPLFYLDSRDASSALEDHLDAHRDLDLAAKNVAMTQDLFDHQAASRFALEQAQTDLAKARARVDRTERALEAIGIHPSDDPAHPTDPRVPVMSPVDGAVVERHVSDGQYVQLDPSPLLTIADLSQVWVEADVFERDVHLLHPGETAQVTTAAYPDEAFQARVDRVSDVLDPQTRTLKVRFVVANPTSRLKPEMFATVVLFVDEQESVISVPATAVLTEGDRTFVYVAVGNAAFARRSVDVLPDAKDTRRVPRGLKPGDRVVTAGAVLLQAEEARHAS